jgi:flavin-dependent dehydrogenase
MEKSQHWDVLIIGGALSGAATAIHLLQAEPGLRVCIVERSTAFSRRVGEATVEVSTYFLTHCLGLTKYLCEQHLTKNGLRFWFTNSQTTKLDECAEIGGKYLARVPAFLVDRATLDEEVLRRAVQLGATLLRPCVIQQCSLNSGGDQEIVLKYQDQIQEHKARWVVDASGVAAYLARKNGWWRQNSEHLTAAVWSRWKGVRDFDDVDLARKFPKWSMACFGIRGTATNHLMGDGWWAWWIPLKGGDVSIGVTFDQRLVKFPEGNTPIGDRLKEFLCRHPVAKELMGDATWTEGDVHLRRNLAYYSTRFAGDGFVLAGDAAGFIDPFYSPGMDWISFTTYRAKELILSERMGKNLAEMVEKHNADFARSYDRWFRSIYLNKYEYMNEYDLMKLTFVLDLGFYYFGVAAQPFRRGAVALTEPLFSTKPSVPFYHLMSSYTRRFAAIARERRRRGIMGRMNYGNRFMFPGFTFSPTSSFPVVKALAAWGWLELKEGWRSWGRDSKDSQQQTIEAMHPDSIEGAAESKPTEVPASV